MAYTTRAKVLIKAGGSAQLLALADLDNDGDEDDGVIDDAIAEADATINRYASKKFAVPFSPVPDAIAATATWLAVYVLRRNRQCLTAGDLTAHESEIKWLEGLRDGENLPGVEPIPAKGSIMRDTASTRPSTKDVSREKLKGYS